jgi:hypothetical protein
LIRWKIGKPLHKVDDVPDFPPTIKTLTPSPNRPVNWH